MLLPYLYPDTIEAGCDEAGRGCLAGAVYAAAVILPPDFHNELLNDSKQLTEKQRYALRDVIEREASAWAIGVVSPEEIDKINILNASLKAMKTACQNVIQQAGAKNFLVLVDGNKLIKEFTVPQKYVIKGDSKSASIAAASILAKVTRDRYMDELDKICPQYGWSKNAGYLTKEHIEAIDKYGLTKYHRPSFLKKHFKKQLALF